MKNKNIGFEVLLSRLTIEIGKIEARLIKLEGGTDSEAVKATEELCRRVWSPDLTDQEDLINRLGVAQAQSLESE